MTRAEFMAEQRRSQARRLIGHGKYAFLHMGDGTAISRAPWTRRAIMAIGHQQHFLETHRFGKWSRP